MSAPRRTATAIAVVALVACSSGAGGGELAEGDVVEIYDAYQVEESGGFATDVEISVAKLETDGDCTAAYVVEDPAPGNNIDLTLGIRDREVVAVITGHLSDVDAAEDDCLA